MKLTAIKFGILVLTGIVVLGVSFTAAANVELKFVEPKKFHDIDVSGMSKNSGIDTVHKQLNELILEVTAGVIDKSDTLVIEVTDMDLAGDMEYFFGPDRRDIRIVRDQERYRLEFSYQLKSSSGEIKKSGEIKIKEFLHHRPVINKSNRYQMISYMRDDIEKWADSEFGR